MPALLVSLLPRGRCFGRSALVSLDAGTLDLVGFREFSPDEYLKEDAAPADEPIQHCRGIVQAGNALFATLFNAVREYVVIDVRDARLQAGRVLTHPQAVDLHGVHARAGRVAAASTGSDSIVSWDLATGDAQIAGLGSQPVGDLRFPARLARNAGYNDWRHVLGGRLHLNDVCQRAPGSLLVCSLTRVLELNEKGNRLLIENTRALMHDGRLTADDEFAVFTDAALGAIVLLELATAKHELIPIADPAKWFVRGLTVTPERVYVLRSEIVPSRQRNPAHRFGDVRAGGTRFGVSVLDREGWTLLSEKVIDVVDAAPGVVAYSAVLWDEAAAAHHRAPGWLASSRPALAA